MQVHWSGLKVHPLKESRKEDSKSGTVGSSKFHPSTQISKYQAKSVRINFVRTLGNRQRFTATKRQLKKKTT